MLVLTRRTNEEIIIDGNIHIRILSAEGNRVRIGIDAPPHVRVDRAEIHARREGRSEDAWLGRSEVFVG